MYLIENKLSKSRPWH